MSDLNRRMFLGSGVIAVGGTALLASSCTDTLSARASDDERWDMINTLRAPGPHVAVGEDPQARIFDRFLGTWDTQYTTIHDDGSRERASGQLIVGWILNGRAVQDIWTWDQPGDSQRWMGTTIRFFDPQRKIWRMAWVSPFALAITLLEGGGDAQRIVLLGDRPPGRLRWSFNDITANDFIWRGEYSTDGGTTWRLREEHHMRRARRSA